jgi:hypothetical protein
LYMMELQVAQGTQLLHHAADELRSLRSQRSPDENFALTNSATAGVT